MSIAAAQGARALTSLQSQPALPQEGEEVPAPSYRLAGTIPNKLFGSGLPGTIPKPSGLNSAKGKESKSLEAIV